MLDRTLAGLSIVSLMMWSGPATACSIAGAVAFKPTLERFSPHPGPAQRGVAGGDYWEPVPTPVVEVVRLTRGKAAPGNTCDDAGILVLSIALPASSPYAIEQFGIYFRVLDGTPPDQIFPTTPIVGSIREGRMQIILAWLDGHPSQRRPFVLQVEAFLVTNGLDVGRSAIFEVRG